MKRDFHMHPKMYLDANRLDAYVQKAISLGIEQICITEHMPLSVSQAEDRIPAGYVADYCRRVRECAEKYEGRLDIFVGIEVDFHPDYTGEIEAVLKEGTFDFVLGSTHMTAGQFSSFAPSTQREYASAALENTLQAVTSGYFDVITHFDKHKGDLLRTAKWQALPDRYAMEDHLPLIEKILDAMAERKVRMEINPALAFALHDSALVYPQQEILEMAMNRGVGFTFGSDAHQADHVGRMLEELRVHPLYGKAISRWEEEKL